MFSLVDILPSLTEGGFLKSKGDFYDSNGNIHEAYFGVEA